jgi:hypothetical protein
VAVSACGTRLRARLHSAHPRGATEDTAILYELHGYQFAWDAPHHVVIRRGKRGGAHPEAPLRKGGAAAILDGCHRHGVKEERGGGGEYTLRLERAKEAMRRTDRPVESSMPVEPVKSSRVH